MQAMRDKIAMYDRCILALGYESEPDTPVGDMIYFLEEERNRIRSELRELEDGRTDPFCHRVDARTVRISRSPPV